MEKKQKVVIRIGASLLALALGALLVWALTFAGDKTAGPLEDVMEEVSQNVTRIENSIVQEAREETRQHALKWFNAYRLNPSRMARSKKMLWGAYDNHTEGGFDPVIKLEEALGTKFPIIQIYVAWGSKKSEQFPFNKAKAIYDLGSIPFITWEPWLTDFSSEDYPHISPDPAARDLGCLAAIARGDYDTYLDQWIKQVKRFGAPLFIRFAHEMNDPYRYPWGPQNNKSQEFLDAWKYVVDKCRAGGATNIIWVWSPHPAYGNFEFYYPGAEYVDWIGVPALNYGTVANWSKWWSFEQIFGNYYSSLSTFGKPMMITEFASLKVGGNRIQWYKDALLSFHQYPLLKSVVFFHSGEDNTTSYKTLNWQIIQDEALVNELRRMIK